MRQQETRQGKPGITFEVDNPGEPNFTVARDGSWLIGWIVSVQDDGHHATHTSLANEWAHEYLGWFTRIEDAERAIEDRYKELSH